LRSFGAGAKSVRTAVTFSTPPNSALQQLTSIFERMADSLERGQIDAAGQVAD
jgi:hypothetical protein